uniref:Uncharacterized protein n=1 Tax=Sphaerodactylus townsendi TaxID=933632 RepID=A0ACB8GDY8_9SAUR
MPGRSVQQNWFVRSGNELFPKACYGRSLLSEWYELIRSGKGFPKEGAGISTCLKTDRQMALPIHFTGHCTQR